MVPFWDSARKARCSVTALERQDIPEGFSIVNRSMPSPYTKVKLAGSQCVGLHSSAGRALQRERGGHGVRIPLKPRKSFFSGYFAIA